MGYGMLQRTSDWYAFLGISSADTARAKDLVSATLEPSAGMMTNADLDALAAALLYHKPRKIFEIGTYMGASSNFFLDLLPQARVVSIAFVALEQLNKNLGPAEIDLNYNNTELGLDKVGSLVSAKNRARYTQLIGDSHEIVAKDFVSRHGRMDFVFIDGDHTRKGVAQDTELAKNIIAPNGAIGWHDANPKKKYIASRLFLEEDLDLTALATADTGIGGVAFWTRPLQQRLLAQTAA